MNMCRSSDRPPIGSRGFITGYLLFGLSLMAIVSAGLINMRNTNADQTSFAMRRDELVSDALSIRTALTNCAVLYPAPTNGSNGDPNTGLPQYPATGGGLVSNLDCPGTGRSIWLTLTQSGGSSMTAPPQRIGMSQWRYVNRKTTTGQPEVFFYIEPTVVTDTRSNNLLDSLANSRRLNVNPSSPVSERYFYTEPVNTGNTSYRRLRSRNLAGS